MLPIFYGKEIQSKSSDVCVHFTANCPTTENSLTKHICRFATFSQPLHAIWRFQHHICTFNAFWCFQCSSVETGQNILNLARNKIYIIHILHRFSISTRHLSFIQFISFYSSPTFISYKFIFNFPVSPSNISAKCQTGAFWSTISALCIQFISFSWLNAWWHGWS